MKITATAVALLATVPGAVAPSIFNISQYFTRDLSQQDNPATPHVKGPFQNSFEKHEILEKRKGGGGGGGHASSGGHSSSGGQSSGGGQSGGGKGSSNAGTAGAAGAGALAGGVGGAALGSAIGNHGSNGSAHLKSAGVFGTDLEKYNLCLAFAVAVGMGAVF